MDPLLLRDVRLIMATGMFLLGIAAFITGVIILIARAWGRDVRTLTNQTARLAQKGFAEDISGLVGNTTALLGAINEMMHTATGIGFFLTVAGGVLMGMTYWLVLQI